jgi:hypothetical protein
MDGCPYDVSRTQVSLDTIQHVLEGFSQYIESFFHLLLLTKELIFEGQLVRHLTDPHFLESLLLDESDVEIAPSTSDLHHRILQVSKDIHVL